MLAENPIRPIGAQFGAASGSGIPPDGQRHGVVCRDDRVVKTAGGWRSGRAKQARPSVWTVAANV